MPTNISSSPSASLYPLNFSSSYPINVNSNIDYSNLLQSQVNSYFQNNNTLGGYLGNTATNLGLGYNSVTGDVFKTGNSSSIKPTIEENGISKQNIWGNALGAISDLGDIFMPEKTEYSGTKGSIAQTLDSAYDGIADALMTVNPLIGGIMKVGGFIGDGVNALGGGTSGMTTTDAILGSSFLNLTPLGLINGFGGSKTNTITKDNEAFAQVGSSYTGSYDTIDDAVTKSGKKYGLFSQRAKNKANEQIAEARQQQDIIRSISDDVSIQNALSASMSAINANRYKYNLLGGYDQSAIRVGRHGMSLEKLNAAMKVVKAQKGTKAKKPKENPELVYNDPEIIAYAKERFPILSDLEINILNDPAFTPRENADEGREGYGDLEYVSKKYSDIPYYKINGVIYQVPDIVRGKSVTIYNNNLGDKANEWIALDALSHGLRDQDKYYQEKLLPILEKAFGDNIDDALAGWVKRNNRRPDKEQEVEIANSALDSIIRDLLVKDGYRESYHNTFEDAANEYLNTPEKKEAYQKLLDYINKVQSKEIPIDKEGGSIELIDPQTIIEEDDSTIELVNPLDITEEDIEEFKEGGSINVIPDGALHARLHHMENADNLTKKGIPVVDNEGEQQAEVECGEIILNLELTQELERLSKKYYDKSSSQKEKDLYAIEAGELLVNELLNNTQDNTNKLL